MRGGVALRRPGEIWRGNRYALLRIDFRIRSRAEGDVMRRRPARADPQFKGNARKAQRARSKAD